jgi:hypothetical protein
MTIEQLHSLYSARPFRAFIMHLVDGSQVAVSHPELMAVADDGRTFTVSLRDDTLTVVDPAQIVDLEIRPAPTKPGPRRKN